ncbi:fructose-specific phosphotransferase system IIA component [Salirhabdus euzebyi]|uniref:Fructose-specific phosphotransferase system IIA component n=1 Tax=Salirhabdus euzebyi TaxID=394506 RepID=A0A841Q606_9BACI|nr:fructose-specific phosphotransferase system IIA component [Salirhabdus euzebyi]
MKLTDLLTEDLIKMDVEGSTKDEVMNELASLIEANGALTEKQPYIDALHAREQQSSTGIGFGIAIPHGKSDAVKEPRVAFGIKRDGVDWASMDDEPANLIFMIAVPEKSAGDEHLKILQMLSRKLIDDEFRQSLLNATTKEDIIKLASEI